MRFGVSSDKVGSRIHLQSIRNGPGIFVMPPVEDMSCTENRSAPPSENDSLLVTADAILELSYQVRKRQKSKIMSSNLLIGIGGR